MANSILQRFTHSTNGHRPFARAFVEAFCPERFTPQDDPQFKIRLTQAWIEQATIGIDALINFRSALHRWQACGSIPDKELAAELEHLHQANFGDWFDYLMAIALVQEIVELLRDDGEEAADD